MRVIVKSSVVFLVLCTFLIWAQIPYAGTTWKLNAEESSGPLPSCLSLDKGILRLPSKMFTGSPTDKPVRPLPANCAIVYKFTWSSDGHTLTMTQPQLDPSFKAVFDKQ